MGRHSPALIFRRAYMPKTKSAMMPITLPAIAYGCHAGWRTFTVVEALLSTSHVYGSDAS